MSGIPRYGQHHDLTRTGDQEVARPHAAPYGDFEQRVVLYHHFLRTLGIAMTTAPFVGWVGATILSMLYKDLTWPEWTMAFVSWAVISAGLVFRFRKVPS
jgi:hypothetical protein